jgi:hypothetical protein
MHCMVAFGIRYQLEYLMNGSKTSTNFILDILWFANKLASLVISKMLDLITKCGLERHVKDFYLVFVA